MPGGGAEREGTPGREGGRPRGAPGAGRGPALRLALPCLGGPGVRAPPWWWGSGPGGAARPDPTRRGEARPGTARRRGPSWRSRWCAPARGGRARAGGGRPVRGRARPRGFVGGGECRGSPAAGWSPPLPFFPPPYCPGGVGGGRGSLSVSGQPPPGRRCPPRAAGPSGPRGRRRLTCIFCFLMVPVRRLPP